MKNNGLQWFERMADVMFSDRFQAKAIISTFGTLGVVCLIGALWNPWQLMFAGMCAVMVLCGFSELKKQLHNCGFCQINQSTLVNSIHIKSVRIEKDCHRSITLDNEECLIVNRRYRSFLKDQV